MLKTGLVVEGGGIKCSYSAAILDRFLDEGVKFDYCIGVSAGSANLLSFLAGQRGRNRRFYVDHIKDPLYYGGRALAASGEFFNLRYIYGDLTNSDGTDPLDYEAVMANPCRMAMVATNGRTGRPAYFYKEQLRKDDYVHIMASCSIPALCRPRLIEGVPYFDGGIADSIPAKRALWDGCDRLVIIQSKPRDFIRKPLKRSLYAGICRNYPNIVRCLDRRHIMYNRQLEYIRRLEAEGKAFVFAPSAHLPMSTYAMSTDDIVTLYTLGLSDYEDRAEELREFLSRA